MVYNRSLRTIVLGIAFITSAWVASAFAQEPFYRNKTVRIIVGGSTGGGYDTYTRAIARHLGKHVPGNPSFVVENMTGAGSIIAANYVYNVAEPDGLTLCHFIGGIILQQVLGKPGIEFDARKFLYLGVPAQDTIAVGVTKASGVSSMEQWLSTKTPVKFGGIGTRHCHRRSPQDTASDSRFAHPTRDRLQGHRGYSAGGQQR